MFGIARGPVYFFSIVFFKYKKYFFDCLLTKITTYIKKINKKLT